MQSTWSYLWLKACILKDQKKGSLWSISKKAVPRAVDRNRIKRWLREEWRVQEEEKALVIVFRIKEEGFYRNLRREEFKRVFRELMRREPGKDR